MERIIPIRFIRMLGSAGDTQNANLDSILRSVELGNRTWRAAAVQFTVRAIDSYVMPTFSTMSQGDDDISWWDLRDELVGDSNTPFPTAPLNAWRRTVYWGGIPIEAPVYKTKHEWLTAITAVYGAPNEITVWLKSKQTSGGHYCQFPHEGNVCVWNGWSMPQNNSSEYQFVGGHELGHYLGLAHVFDGVVSFNDPSTQQPFKQADRWDLVYKPGTSTQNPHTYYSSRAAALAAEASLKPINIRPNDVDNCSRDVSTGIVSCNIGSGSYTENHTQGSDAMKGLAFPHPGPRQGDNAMSYLWPRFNPHNVSDSQILVVRKFLRWDQKLESELQAKIYKDFNSTDYPGLYNKVKSGQRTQLGSGSRRPLASKLDFDGDGRRDIGAFIPRGDGSRARFIVLLSSYGYSQSKPPQSPTKEYLEVELGSWGDIPVPADYNGDGRTDVAVFQPGGGLNRDDMNDTAGHWYWCPTASAAPSTTCTSANRVRFEFGRRDDIPVAGLDFGGDTKAAYTVFRQSDGTWYFRQQSWPASPAYRSAKVSADFSGAVPLPGLYDCDELSDLAIYEPLTAKFKLLRSEQNWSVSQMTTRQFSTSFIPGTSGTVGQMAGVVPMAGQHHIVACGDPCPVPPFCWPSISFRPRLSASLFCPQAGTWNTIRDPVNASSVNSCNWGGPGVVPVGGIDWNQDGLSDYVYRYDYQASGAGSVFFMKAATVSGCGGSQTARWNAGIFGERTIVYSVSDMTGDGRSELLLVDPKSGEVRWLTSGSGYTSGGNVTFDDSHIEVL